MIAAPLRRTYRIGNYPFRFVRRVRDSRFCWAGSSKVPPPAHFSRQRTVETPHALIASGFRVAPCSETPDGRQRFTMYQGNKKPLSGSATERGSLRDKSHGLKVSFRQALLCERIHTATPTAMHKLYFASRAKLWAMPPAGTSARHYFRSFAS